MANVLEMAKQQKRGTEEMGRIVRYDFFNYVANKVSADKIAIAHTENDNAETVLMNLMRGASLEGLKGIEPIRGKFIRPLIECSRDEIEAYCEENKLDPKFDKTNNDNIYTRNKIRNLLIPYIKKEFNPNIVDSLNRLAVLARQDAKYFSEIVKNEYKNLVIFENVNIFDNYEQINGLKFYDLEGNEVDLEYTIDHNEIIVNLLKIEKADEESDRLIDEIKTTLEENKYIELSKICYAQESFIYGNNLSADKIGVIPFEVILINK